MKQTGFFKRLLSAVLFVALTLSALPVSAETTQYGYIVVPESSSDRVVNFRKNPNTNDNTNYPLARLPEYWVVEILGLKDVGGSMWYNVQANVGVNDGDPVKYETGFIKKDFVQLMTAAETADFQSRGGNFFRYASLVPEAESAIPPLPDPTVPASAAVQFYVMTIQNGVTLYREPGGIPPDISRRVRIGASVKPAMFPHRPLHRMRIKAERFLRL